MEIVMRLFKNTLKENIDKVSKYIIIILIIFITPIIAVFLLLLYDDYDSQRVIKQCVTEGKSLEICQRYID